MCIPTKNERSIHSPDWFTMGSIYQINPRTFSPEGTIAAVTKELPFLKELGFTVMYLCPIFEEDDSDDPTYLSPRQLASQTGNPKNPYRMNDYFKIDSEYGTIDDLREFVAEAHRLGLRVMLDLVYLHIGPNAPIIKEHPEFAQHDENGNMRLTKWKFPYLNFENAGLREYLWCNMTYYVGAFGVDGFRCDVGDKVPLDFWVEGRRRITAIKPDAVLLVEGIKVDYLEQAFDSCYHFAWHGRMYKAFAKEDGITAADVRQCHEEFAAKIPRDAFVMHDIDNHDTVTDRAQRVEIFAGHDGMELIEVLNYTIDGVPMIYCGNELCDEATINMFANRFYMGKFEITDRSDAKKNEPAVLRRLAVMRALNTLKATSEILRDGETVWIDNTEPEKVLSFMRVVGSGKIVTVGNISSDPVTVKLSGVDLNNGYKVILESEARAEIKGDTLVIPSHGYIVAEL